MPLDASPAGQATEASRPAAFPFRPRPELSEVRVVSLRAAHSDEEYDLHLAALEWSLADAIILDSAEDIKSRDTWRGRLSPYEHQVQNLFTFCRRLPVALLADDVGLGKTISAGLIMSELMARRRVSRTLVLAPSILCDQWVEELGNKFAVRARAARGSALREAVTGTAPVVVTTYESARSRLSTIEPGMFDMLILDEAHKLRNLHGKNGASGPPLVALRVKEVLEERLFKYVLMLTATPIQNRLWDLYSLIDLLAVGRGHANPLGSPAEFENRFVADPGDGARTLRPLAAPALREVLRQYMVRTRREEVQLLFPRRKVRLFRVNASAVERELQHVVASIIIQLNPLEQSSVAQAMMSSPQALALQLEHMAVRREGLQRAALAARRAADLGLRPTKLNGLLTLVGEFSRSRPKDWRVIVFTTRKETQAAIVSTLLKEGVSVGTIKGGQPRENAAAIRGFSEDPPRSNVLVSTDSGAEGVNLQAANVVVNFDLPWNPMVVEQRIGRVQRLASKHENVIVVNLVVGGSFEERIVARLMAKLQTIASTVGDIEAILESTGREGGDEREGSFESAIRNLVVKALLGQDVEEATRREVASIERAQAALEARREELDSTLGPLSDAGQNGPAMPRLETVPPAMGANDFTLSALAAEGGKVVPGANGLFEHWPAAGPREVISFDEEAVARFEERGAFMGVRPKLYQPGKPSFERLVQRWHDRSAARIGTFAPRESDLAGQIAAEWSSKIEGATFVAATCLESRPRFRGSVVVRARAGNGVDSYEKLIDVECRDEDGTDPGAEFIAAPVWSKADWLPGRSSAALRDIVSDAVVADPDVGKFWEFYERRLAGESKAAAGDARLLKRIEDDLRPVLFADVEAAKGVEYNQCRMEVVFRLDEESGHEYKAVIDTIPATGVTVAEPEMGNCERTGRRVPVSCLEQCAVSKATVLRHLLVTSEETGRRALPEWSTRCCVTGKVVFVDEVKRSAITGKCAAGSLCRESIISGRTGLPEDFATCEITGSEVLVDELEKSEISGRAFRIDEAVTSAASGTRGHRSEFVRCEFSGEWLLPSETAKSDCSGKIARADKLQRSERAPHRAGWPSEFVTCSVTHRQLLCDEVDQSAVSGRLAEKGLMQPSARSLRLALPEELVECDVQKIRLLPEETDICSLTGRRVDDRLLTRSDVSGRRGLTSLMRRCELTQRVACPDEVGKCELTGRTILLSELRKCCASLLTVGRDKVVVSSVSGEFVRADLAVKSVVSGALCAPDEATMCRWFNRRILKAESDVCRLTGLTVAEGNLNGAGELAPLRLLLEGKGGVPSDELRQWLATLDRRQFGRIRSAMIVASTVEPEIVAVCCEVGSGFIGGLTSQFRPWHVGLVVSNVGGRHIIGRIVRGRRHEDGWRIEATGTIEGTRT